MYNFLQKVLDREYNVIKIRKQKISLKNLKQAATLKKSKQDVFTQAVTQGALLRNIGIIAEVKFASPTNPNLGSPNDLANLIRSYLQAGADAISVITEKHFFNGCLEFVSQIKKIASLPILQKDFIVDEYQIFESKNLGADAILLIAKILDQKNLNHFVELALDLGIEPVVEINNEKELKKACSTKTNIIAANARDLNTLEIDVDNACKLLSKIPKKYIKLGFSGVKGKEEAEKYKNAGAGGVLIGTSLMKSDNIRQFIKEIRI